MICLIVVSQNYFSVIVLIENLKMVDQVIVGTEMTLGLDFETAFRKEKPQFLAVTDVIFLNFCNFFDNLCFFRMINMNPSNENCATKLVALM